MTAALGRRLVAEYIGTGLLVAVVVGSGIAATRLTHDGALQRLVNSVVTAFGLTVLILVFIPAGARTSTRWSPQRTGSWAAIPRTTAAWPMLPPSWPARSPGPSAGPRWLMPCSASPSSAPRPSG
jgi:hypothetical protein